jgi:Flp pilus assembly secretin CpaC
VGRLEAFMLVATLCVGMTGQGMAQAPAWAWHTVQKGETLPSLAQRYQTTVAALMKLNGWTTPRPLRPGERIKVPVKPHQSSTPSAKPTSNPASPPKAPTQPPSSQGVLVARKVLPSLPQPRLLQVTVGKAIALKVPGLRSVSVAAPEIADVQVLTADTLGVLGKKVGNTSLIVVTATQTMIWEVQVTPEPFLRERLQQLIGLPTVTIEVVKDAIILTGTVPTQSERERATALARLFATTVLDLLRVEEPPTPPTPPKPALPSPEEIERAIGIKGVRVRLVGDSAVLEGTVETPDEATRAEKVAVLLVPKVINLLQVRPLSADELQALIAIPTVKVRETPEALVLEGTVPTQEDLNRLNELAGQARRKVVNWVKVVAPPPPPTVTFAQKVKDAIGIPTVEVQGDEKGLVLSGTVATQAEKERALRIARFMLGLPPVPPPTPPTTPTPLMVVPGVGAAPMPTPPTGAPTGAAPAEPRLLDLLEVKGGKQIRVELRVLEINRTALRDLGVNFPGLAEPAVAAPPGVLPAPGVAIGQIPNPATGGVTGVAQRTPIQAFLQALEQRNVARTLSAPSAVVLSGQEARFNVGGEIPIPVATVAPGVGTTTAVEFRPFGLVMSVLPTVEPNGKIRLTVSAEVSELDPGIAVNIGGAIIFGTRTRKASTQVELASQETLVMSGLVQRLTQTIINRVPLLSKIPILGELFTSRRFQQGETELAILVTPVLVEPTEQ